MKKTLIYFALGIGALISPVQASTWTNLGSGISGLAGRCWGIQNTTNGHVFVVGDFGSPANHVAIWNGSSWSTIGNLSLGGNAVVRDNNGHMVVGGAFSTAGGVSASKIAKWDGSTWSSLGTGLAGGDPNAMVLGNDGHVYVGGHFTNAGGLAVNRVAKWNGSTWTNLGSGVDGGVYAMAKDGAGNVYMGGNFTNAGGISANRVAKWNGTTWTNLGAGMNSDIYGLCVDNAGNLYAVGDFTTAGGVSANRVAKWNGTTWTNLGSGLDVWAYAVVTDGAGNVYVGGNFTTAGGGAANRMAKWNGSAWSAMGSGMNGYVYCFLIDGQGYLHAGGGFTTADGKTANGIARWTTALTTDPPHILVLGTNGTAIANNEAASAAKGSDFGSLPSGQSRTNLFLINNTGDAALTVSGVATSGTGAAAFTVLGMPGTVAAGTTSNFLVRFSPAAAQTYTCVVAIANSSTNTPYHLCFAGIGTKQDQTISFPAIGAQTATSTVGLAATASSGLGVSFSVGSGLASISGGTNLTFTGAGSVSIVASQAGDANWNAAPNATNTFDVTKATAAVNLADLSQTYDGGPKAATATTVPAGLSVDLTYNGSGTTPTAAGSYAVTGTVNEALYQGSATGTLVVAKAAASIYLQNLSQTYNGAARTITATTMPAGLTVAFTYDGLAGAPTNAGTYAVTGTVAEANYEGLAAGSLVVAKAGQSIVFNELDDQIEGTVIGLVAFSDSGLGISLNVIEGDADLDGTNLTLNATGTVTVVASQAGDANWNPAADVSNTFAVLEAPLIGMEVLGVNGAAIASGSVPDADKGTDYGAWIWGGAATNTFAITNQGNTALLISGVSTGGTGAASFRVRNLPASVGPKASVSFQIVFTPTAAGLHTAVVAIANNSPTAPYFVQMQGTGLPKDQTINFPAIPNQLTTNAVGLSATASSGLPVSFSVLSGSASITGGTNLSFTGAGAVSLVAAQAGNADWNAAPDVTNTFTVTKATAGMTLNDLNQTYNGAARVVTATTVPGGLAVEITYNGSATAPTAAGSYAVTGAVNEVLYQGVQTGTLVVAKANQTITFPAIPDQIVTNTVGLAATASSTLSISFSLNSGPGMISGGTNLTFSDTGTVRIVAAQAGDANWNAAPNVTNAITVNPAIVVGIIVRGTNGAEVYSGDAVSAAKGTDFGRWPAGASVTNILSFTNSGGAPLTISGWTTNGAGAAAFRVAGLPAQVSVGGVSNFTVVFNPAAGGIHTAAVQIANDSPITPYVVNLAGSAWQVIPNNGPLAGGNTIVITNGILGNGADITNVLVGSVRAVIQNQGVNWVGITAPTNTTGTKSITIQSTSAGTATFANAYSYNLAGYIYDNYGPSGQWIEVAGLPKASHGLIAGVLNGYLYAAGGSWSYLTNVYRFNGTTWTEVAGLPIGRTFHAGGVFNSALYVVGGGYGNEVTNVYRYDGTNWTAVAGLPAGRRGMAFGVLSGAMYIAGGELNGTAKTNVYRFNGSTWTEVAGLPVPVRFCTGAVLNNAFYVIGGDFSRNVYRFDGTNWTQITGLPAELQYPAATEYHNQIYVMGQQSGSGKTYRFDGINWTVVSNMPQPRQLLAAGVLNDAMYAVGGWNGGSRTNMYRYVDSGAGIMGVVPSSGSWTGMYYVTISGSNLCSGTDVTNVTLNGASVASIFSQSATQVVVRAGVASAEQVGLGDVRVFSTSYGETVKSNAFRYTGSGLKVLGSGDAGCILAGRSITNVLSITNSGNQTLTISGWTTNGAGAAKFQISGIPATVGAGAVANFNVVFTPGTIGSYTCALQIANNSPTPNYGVSLRGSACQLSTNAGPYGGGNSLTITNGTLGNGTDITNVTVGGVRATITGQGVNWVTFILPATSSAGATTILIQSASVGTTTIAGAYTYNPRGRIGISQGGLWTEVAGLPQIRDSLAADVVNGMLYAFSGYGPGGWASNVYRYNMTNWTEVAGIPRGRSGAAAGNLDSILYSVAGYDYQRGVSTNVYRYDGTNWTEVAGLPQPRLHLAAGVLNGSLYAVAGANASWQPATNVYRYNGMSWGEVAGLPQGRSHLAVGVLNNALYAVGGENSTNVYRFDGTNWMEVAGLPKALHGLAVGVLNDALYAVGGYNSSSGYSTNVYRFNGANWTEVAGLPKGVTVLAVGVLGDGIYAVGGRSQSAYSTSNVYRYSETTDFGVAPSNGLWSGGYTVKITGLNLGNGSDVTNVTLCGINAASITSQSSTQIVIVAGSGGSGVGDVRVYSTSYGMTVKTNGFTYTGPGFRVLGTNGAIAASGEAASKSKGTDFGHVRVGIAFTNTFGVTNHGTQVVSIQGWTTNGAGASAFQVSGLPSQVSEGSVSNFQIAFAPGAPGNYSAYLAISNNSPMGVYTVQLAGASFQLSTNNGPAAGGNSVTITNGALGNGSDITSVQIGGQPGVITGQGANWVTITLPANSSGSKDVVIQSASAGSTTLPGAYSYNPAGSISGVAPASGAGAGGYPVTITGSNLGNGGDITHVTLCGVNAASISSQSATQVVIVAGADGLGLGDVRVYSVSRGLTALANAFTYFAPGIYVLDANGLVITNGTPPSQAAGTDFGAVPTNESATLVLSITNVSATLPLTIGGAGWSGAGAASFSVSNLPGMVAAGSASNFTVRYAPDSLGLHDATLWITNNGDVSPYRVRFAGYGLKPGEIGLDRALISFRGVYGGANPTAQIHVLTNKGGVEFSFSNTVKYGSTAYGWLDLAPPAGSLGAGAIRAHTGTVSIAGLNAGTYYATNRVSSPTAVNSPVNMLIELTVDPAPQTIDFANPGDQVATNRVVLSATATSELGVSFAVLSGPASITGDVYLAFSGAGAVSIVASQEGDGNWEAAPDVTRTFNVARAPAGIALADLEWTYDGEPKEATATSDPADLYVRLTYDDSETPPAEAGSYAVTGTVDHAIYEGTVTGTLVIGKATAGLSLEDLTQNYDGSAKAATAISDPSGLTVELTYAGNAWAPTNAGIYAVTGTVADANYAGEVVGELVIEKGDQTAFMMPPMPQLTTNRVVLEGGASSGLPVTFTVASGLGVIADGTNLTFTGAGEVSVVVSQGGDDNWNPAPDSTNTFLVEKAPASVTLTNLSQTYDGLLKTVLATTDPEGLDVAITYNGDSMPPIDAGTYAVTGTISDAMYQGEATDILVVAKAAATVALNGLSQVYDGTPRSVTATTDPEGLTVEFTYDGDATAPTAAGSYAVTGIVNDVNYEGSAAGTLVIGKATAAVTLGSLSQTYDGTPQSATATTDPAGLTVDLTYDGSATAPTAAGSYAVTGTVNEANYEGSASGTLTIGKAAATVFLLDLAQTYDGTARTVTSTTMPAGLMVELTYDGNAWAPTNAGNYAVTGTVNEVNWQGSATGLLTVGKAAATVTLGSLSQTYDGTPKSATATTDPVGLTVDFTYDGSATAPTAAGSYAVTGTVNEANYEGSASGTLTIGKAAATVTLESLSQTYDGTPRSATATTDPVGLTVDFTYDGSATAPTAAGSYAVTGTVNEANWQGSATGTLVIGKATATVALGNLSQVFDGTPKSATATTDPAGLTVDFTYDGSTTAPTAAGSYAVTGTVNEANYAGFASGTLTIGKATATVTLGSLSQTYDGTPKSATATTDPVGLAVEFTYDGSATAPTAAGSYAVTGTVNEANYQGSAAGTLTIGKAAATVTLGSLCQTYDGTPRSATATTDPVGLTVDFTYDGSATAPTAAGSYAVTGTVNEANYEGSASGTLTIGKAAATVTLGSLSQTYDGTPRGATATTDPAGLAVGFTYDGETNQPVDAGSYAVTGTVHEANWQGSATGTLTIAKAAAEVYLLDLVQTYDGTAKCASATTMPAGLVVEFTYDGLSWAPTNAGSYAVTGTVVEANWQGASTGTLVIGKAAATVYLGDLSQTYDGTPKSASMTTDPAGLTVDITYDGSATAPTAAGSYAVTGTVNEANWQGSATGTLVIAKAAAAVELGSLAQTYDGTPKAATATTDPAGLVVEFTYDGSATAPAAAGSYAVTGTVNEANWQGSATGTLTIGKAAATVELGDLNHVYDGTPKEAAATTDPAGLTVDITYDGSATAPVAAGSYAVTGLVNEANYQGSATGTLTIGKAGATVELGSLAHVYDGTPKAATATTDPAGLAVDLTYNGLATAPTNAGSYTVVGTVNEANYHGAATGTLTIAKANQVIANFRPEDGSRFAVGENVQLTAQASSGLPVQFATLDNRIARRNGSTLTFVNPGRARIRAYQPGDANWNPARMVQHEYEAGGQPVLGSSAFLPRESTASRQVQLLRIWNPARTEGVGLRVTFSNLKPGIAVANRTGMVNGRPVIELRKGLRAGGRVDIRVIYATTGGARANRTPPRVRLDYLLLDQEPVEPLVAGDIDGDGKANLTVFRPAGRGWDFLYRTDVRQVVWHGAAGAQPVLADYDGDGLPDFAVFQPATSQWTIHQSSNGKIVEKRLGARSDIPVPGDYDGDGVADAATYRPATGRWSIWGSRAGRYSAQWGLPGHIPVPADYDGDETTDLAVYNPANGEWQILQSSDGRVRTRRFFAGSRPVPADYDGDGQADLAIYRPASGIWRVLQSSTGETVGWQLGSADEIPVVADHDGDGQADVAVYHRISGQWTMRRSSNGSLTRTIHGGAGAVPVLLNTTILEALPAP
jgi:N-acetylneuraminic acid mutarotase